MQDTGNFYDIFFIYHPVDIDFTRELSEQLKSQNVVCRFDEEFGQAVAGPQPLRDSLLRSHTIAIVLSPESAESQLCNELVEYAVANDKRFISLIVDENIKAVVHPAIAENAYVFFRAADDHDKSVNTLIQLLQIDAHLRLHTEFLVGARKWDAAQRPSELLLAQDRAEEARQWLADGANRLPKPSQLLVEYIHASRRQKGVASRGFPTHAAFGLVAVLIIAAIVGIVQNVMAGQSAATATAAFIATSELQTRIADSVAATAAAESNVSARVISNLAATSARIRGEVLATAAAQAQIATEESALTATVLKATAIRATEARATEMAQLQSEIAVQAVLDGARRALDEGELDLALALAWEAAQTRKHSWSALRILRQAIERSPVKSLDAASLVRIHPAGLQFALVPHSRKQVRVLAGDNGRLLYEINNHDNELSAIAYGGDGQLLITASQDGEVLVRSSEDGVARHRLHEHVGPVHALALYRTESKLVTAGADGLVLWDLDSGDRLASYAPEAEGGLSTAQMLVTSDDSRLLVWSNAGGKIKMAQYSAETLEPLTPDIGDRVYLGYNDDGSIAYSGGRSLPAYAGDPNTGDLVLWNPSSGQELTRLSEGVNWSLISAGNVASATDSLEFIAFGDSAALLGIQNSIGEKRAVLVALDDGKLLRTFDDDLAASLLSAQFLDAETVLSITSDNRLITWSLTNGGMISQLGILPQALARIEADASGRIVLGHALDGGVYLWHTAPLIPDQAQIIHESADFIAINQTGDAVLISDSDGTRLQKIANDEILFISETRAPARMNEPGSHFAVFSDREFNLLDARNGQIKSTWTIDSDLAEILSLAPNGESLLAESDSGALLWLRSDQAEPQSLNKGDIGATELARIADDGSLALTLHRGGALLWQADSTDPIKAYALGVAPEYAAPQRFSVAFADSGDRLLFFVRLDNGLAGLTKIAIEGDLFQRHAFVDVAYGELTADGKYLLLFRVGGKYQVIDTSNLEILHEFSEHGVSARKLALLDARNWLYAAVDKNLLIWDLASDAQVQRFENPNDVLAFSMSQDGRRVLSADANGVFRLIRVETSDELLDRIRARISPRDLSCAEREQYLALPFCE